MAKFQSPLRRGKNFGEVYHGVFLRDPSFSPLFVGEKISEVRLYRDSALLDGKRPGPGSRIPNCILKGVFLDNMEHRDVDLRRRPPLI